MEQTVHDEAADPLAVTGPGVGPHTKTEMRLLCQLFPALV